MAIGTDEVLKAVESFLKNPGGFSNLENGLTQIERIGMQEAAGAALAEEGVDAELAVGVLGDALGLSVGWVVLLAVSAVIISAKIMENVLLLMASKAPWIFGDALRGIVKTIFAPLDNLEATVGKKMADVSTQLIISWLKALRQFLIFELGAPLVSGGGVSTATVNHLQHEIDQTNARVTKLQQEFNHLNTSTTGGIAPSPGSQPLQDRVTRLERNELVVAHDLNVLHSDVTQLSQNQDSLHRTVAQLQVNLNAIRTVAYSAQDVLNELVSTTAKLEHQITEISPVVDANARQIALLSPLGLLLVNGMPGLRNLEKLERKPCQCPQLPGLPGDDAGLLAAYEFVTNG